MNVLLFLVTFLNFDVLRTIRLIKKENAILPIYYRFLGWNTNIVLIKLH